MRPVADKEGNPVTAEPLQFTAYNHDDILKIVGFMRERPEFTEDMASNFAVGLKLMGEVILANKKEPFFAELMPHFQEIMKIVKK